MLLCLDAATIHTCLRCLKQHMAYKMATNGSNQDGTVHHDPDRGGFLEKECMAQRAQKGTSQLPRVSHVLGQLCVQHLCAPTLSMSPILQTKVSGIGSALIHCPCLFFTCKVRIQQLDFTLHQEMHCTCAGKHSLQHSLLAQFAMLSFSGT